VTPTKILIGQIIIVFAVVIGAVWGATQWTAITLGHDPWLGAPWFLLGDYKIYHPWRLFQWWYAYEAYAPAVFNKAGAMAATGGFLGAGTAIAGSVCRSGAHVRPKMSRPMALRVGRNARRSPRLSYINPAVFSWASTTSNISVMTGRNM